MFDCISFLLIFCHFKIYMWVDKLNLRPFSWICSCINNLIRSSQRKGGADDLEQTETADGHEEETDEDALSHENRRFR